MFDIVTKLKKFKCADIKETASVPLNTIPYKHAVYTVVTLNK